MASSAATRTPSQCCVLYGGWDAAHVAEWEVYGAVSEVNHRGIGFITLFFFLATLYGRTKNKKRNHLYSMRRARGEPEHFGGPFPVFPGVKSQGQLNDRRLLPPQGTACHILCVHQSLRRLAVAIRRNRLEVLGENLGPQNVTRNPGGRRGYPIATQKTQ